MVLGITGGSGTGKTTVSDIFRDHGIQVIDADIISREVVKPGNPALLEICACFGDEYLTGEGTLDRKRLGERVFSDPAALSALNGIIHKHILAEIEEIIARSSASLICVDGAALIESGMDKQCDKLLVVLADREIREKRIIRRDNLSEKEASRRINAQKPDEFYLEKADFVVYNNSDRKYLHSAVKAVIREIRSMI